MSAISTYDQITVLKSDSLLFKGLHFPYCYDERFENLTLYLVKKRSFNNKNSFIVFSPTKYVSDDDFTSMLQAHDSISYPLSLNIYKEFKTLKHAESFYQEILQQCPSLFNLSGVINSEEKLYGYDCSDSVHIKAFGKRVKHDDFYVKELVRHGYQQIMLRMFRFGNQLIINKCLNPRFETEEKCIQVFEALKEHFGKSELKLIPYQGEDTKLNDLFEQLRIISIESDRVEMNVVKDPLKRITSFELSFKVNDISVQIRYRLPSRNGNYHGYTTNSTISYYTGGQRSFYSSYDHLKSFLQKLEEVVALFN